MSLCGRGFGEAMSERTGPQIAAFRVCSYNYVQSLSGGCAVLVRRKHTRDWMAGLITEGECGAERHRGRGRPSQSGSPALIDVVVASTALRQTLPAQRHTRRH